jgi:large subunit ribosomal protein L22
MEATAKAYLKYIRISPRKVQIVLDLIRGKNLKVAEAILKHTPKAACVPVLKLMRSAAANAENNHSMDKANLYVAECFACPGPTLKRIQPVSKGRAHRILKRTSHITIALKERTASAANGEN